MWLSEMVKVRGHAVAKNFHNGFRAARAHALLGLHHENRCAFAEGEAIAVGIERARDAGFRKRLKSIEPSEDKLAERVVAAGDGKLATAISDLMKRMPDGVCAGSAGVGNDLRASLEPERALHRACLALWLVVLDS
jgi:hypothetical protein